MSIPTLHQLAQGSGTGLLVLHPLGADRHFFDPLVPLLSGVPIHGCDLPGHGDTGASEDDTIALMSARVADALRAQAGPPPVLVGVSLGALVAVHLAATEPTLVAGLVVADGVARYPDMLKAQWYERAEALQTGRSTVESYLAATLAVWFDDEVGPGAVDYVRTCLSTTTSAGYAQACRALEAADVEPLLSAVTQPAMVVCGSDDAPPFVQAAPVLAAGLGAGKPRWLPHRHACLLQDPASFAEVLLPFLATLASEGSHVV